MIFKSFKEFVESEDDDEEHAIAGYGDWKPSIEKVFLKSKRMMEKEWEFQDKINVNGVEVDIYINSRRNITS